MSAIDTVLEVIQWAQLSDGTPPPVGDLRAAEGLLAPPKILNDALAELITMTAARLRLDSPPLGDSRPLGTGSLLLAAAIGLGRMPKLATMVLDSVPAPHSSHDWMARHGLVKPALPFLAEILADDCRNRSPLTAVLDRPAPGGTNAAMDSARRLLADRYGRLCLVKHLAQPTTNLAVRQWRQNLMICFNTGNTDEQNFVLDVYEAMMIFFQAEALQQINEARAIFNDPQACACEEKIQMAMSIAAGWEPLWSINRTNVNRIRERFYLDYGYWEGIKLFTLSQRLQGGSL